MRPLGIGDICMTEKMGFEKNRAVQFEWRNKFHLYRQPDGTGVRLRSNEEYKWARYLDILLKSGYITNWEYEPKTFEFEERYRKRGQYTPDFRVTNADSSTEWYEIKASFTDWQHVVYKFKQFKADYPNERITLVVPSCPVRSTKRIIKLDKAKKYVDDVIYSRPIFRKLGF